jgi:hypothetical protein
MNFITEKVTFKVPLTSKFHQIAEQLRKEQISPETGKQVYLNTLSVLAVDSYLQCMGIETDLTASNSQNPVMTILSDTADLIIKNIGKLECRPLLPNQEFVHIPLEAQDDRIGYMVVLMSESLREATLLGFVKELATEEFPINQLQSLEDFLEYIEQIAKPPVYLNQWLQNIFDQSWQIVENILDTLTTPEENLAYRMRSANRDREMPLLTSNAIPGLIDLLKDKRNKVTLFRAANLLGDIAYGNQEAIAALTDMIHSSQDEETRRQAAINLGKIDPNNSQAGVRRAKLIDFGMILNGHHLVLIVTVMPDINHKTRVHFCVSNVNQGNYLPSNLKLTILDEHGKIFQEVTSRNADNIIQKSLKCSQGDTFTIRISLENVSITEYFAV